MLTDTRVSLQPFTGNQQYVDAYRMLVGREYRVVNNMDLVPSLPPVDSYRHVAAGIWGTQGKVRSNPSSHLCIQKWSVFTKDHMPYTLIKLSAA